MPTQYRYRTGDQALVRQINLSVIMHNLRNNAPISRAALAEMTGLNKTTVSSLVSELIEHQFVKEVGLESTGTGRPAMMLTLNPQAGFIISGEIGVDFILITCMNFAPQIIWRYKEKIDPSMGQQAIIDRTLDYFRQAAVEGRKSCDNLLGVAVGVPGLVDQATGTLLFAPNLGWENTPLRTKFKEVFDAPLFVDNEASMAALGEHYFGVAQGYDEVLYISAGVGLGGGIIHGGQVCRGVTGVAGEIGHMTMIPDGDLCGCGNRGCWETQVSQRTLFKHVNNGIHQGKKSQLTEMTENDLNHLTVPLIVEAAQKGDFVAQEALHKIGHHLGIGIASLVNALNPELVVFGGILSLASDFILPIVEEELQLRALRWVRQATQVVKASHGFDACIMGGVATVYQAILAEPGNRGLRTEQVLSLA